jgi:hypothetical protein
MAGRTEFVGDEIDKAFKESLQARLIVLEEARNLSTMKAAVLQHEAKRLELKLGKEHSRVTLLNERVKVNLELIRELDVEQELARIRVREVGEKDALVHGRVTDENGRGIPGLTVSLVSSTGALVKYTAPAITDRSGYFALTLPEDTVKELAVSESGVALLAVFTRRYRRVYQSKTPLAITPQARIRHNVSLNRGDITQTPGLGPRPSDGETVPVPNILSLPEYDAMAALKEAGLVVGERNTRPVIDQIGLVLEQDPAAGAPVSPQSPVALVIGVAQQVEMPDLVGQPLDNAVSLIRQRHLAVGTVNTRADERKTVVLEQKPQGGTLVPVGTQIELIVGGEREEQQDLRAKILEAIVEDRRFNELEVSERALSNRLKKNDFTTDAQFQSLLELPDRELRNVMDLPNLRSAQVLKEILKRALEKIGGG